MIERYKEGWVEQDQVITIVQYIDCGMSGMLPWGGPAQRYMNKDDL